MTPDAVARRRATDATWPYRVWVSLPLVDRHTGEWSLTRSLSAAYAYATIHLMESTHERGMTATQATLIVSLALASMACAFGKTVFAAIASRIAGGGSPSEVPHG